MKELYDKMAKEAINAQKSVVSTINEKRGTEFKVTDAKPYVDAIIEDLRKGEKSTEMLKFLDEEGNEKYLNVSISPLMKNGKVMEAVGVADDLSEHQRMINEIAY